MVFEKITLFEPHFEDVSFGSSGSRPVESDEAVEFESGEEDGGRGILAPVLVSLGLALATTYLVRRRFGGDDDDITVEAMDVDEPTETAAE